MTWCMWYNAVCTIAPQLRRQLEEAVAAQRQAETRADERLDEIQDARMEIERVSIVIR